MIGLLTFGADPDKGADLGMQLKINIEIIIHCSNGEYYAACNIIQHDQFDGWSLMVYGDISLKGRTDLHVTVSSTLNAVRC